MLVFTLLLSGTMIGQPDNANGLHQQHVPTVIESLQHGFMSVEMSIYAGRGINERDNTGRSALHYLASSCETHTFSGFYHQNTRELIEEMIKKGAEVNTVAHDGNTPAHFAAGIGNWRMLRQLVQAGADPNKPNMRGISPLQFAMVKKKHACVSAMLDPQSHHETSDDQYPI